MTLPSEAPAHPPPPIKNVPSLNPKIANKNITIYLCFTMIYHVEFSNYAKFLKIPC